MFYYFECQRCKQVSDVFPGYEVPGESPSCTKCQPAGGSTVLKKTINYYIFHCTACAFTSGECSAAGYPARKGMRPKCPKCKRVDDVFFLKPHIADRPKRIEKRRHPGLLPPSDDQQFSRYETQDLESEALEQIAQSRAAKRRTTELTFDSENKLKQFPVEPGSSTDLLAKSEARYQFKKRFRKEFDQQHGLLSDQQDPMQTEKHPGKVISLEQYRNASGHKETVRNVSYPKMSSSAPTIVNSAKLVDRAATWDYRELGPNSLLRRLSSLVYVIKVDDGSDDMNPVEVQAMWAGGALFLSSNNYKFSAWLLTELQNRGSVKNFIEQIKLPPRTTGAYDTMMRNFGTQHEKKLPVYQEEIRNDNFPSYFKYKWEYVFSAIRNALSGVSDIASLTVARRAGSSDFRHWTAELVAAGKVYVVLPKQFGAGSNKTHFVKKMVHAEELFFPILMQLKTKLSDGQPAFIGGVKTPCRTCALVLQAAASELGTKLVLPTNAFGHYWKASGMHVPDAVFLPSDESIVFGARKSIDDGSIHLYDTEMPLSPQR